jgi:hypothetical protein
MTAASHEVDGTICQTRDHKSSRRPLGAPGVDAEGVAEWTVPGMAHRRWLEDPANGGEGAGDLQPRADAMAALALETLEEA